MNILEEKQYKTKGGEIINYYEKENEKKKLLIIHAQGTDSTSYQKVENALAKKFHLYLIDCYGHGKSSHNKEKYFLKEIGNDIIEFIENVCKDKVVVLGHSSGGLIAGYIAANTDKCEKLILEDPPFFSSCGDRRFSFFNYKDLSTVCHSFINQEEEKDFITYYFKNQFCWNFFPEESREKVRNNLSQMAKKYRIKKPNKMLKVPFWPKAALEAFRGMNNYDPYFGENFYNDNFNIEINYEELLKNIKCKTLIMKANTTIGKDGTIQGAMAEEDFVKVKRLIPNNEVKLFDCGHGVHMEKKKEFIKEVVEFCG